ncbi:transporter component [Vibrio ishigakensis]|uniref:Transporter component n=2 Tax=Vibrio ishigakensis TaxID=1481914 RepID=A0A0B8NRJ5_9VIBR|nr:transporter component [Vibrio ishigakensis]
MMTKFISLFSGLLFGLGMAVSGMVDPHKVIAFLDVAGNWDPSLAFVMGGALMVFIPGYQFLIKKRTAPIAGAKFSLSVNKHIDRKLLTGAGFFGLGWGLAGICPGPVVSSLGVGNGQAWLFLVAMLLGMLAANKAQKA